jgi:hypothetical protein
MEFMSQHTKEDIKYIFIKLKGELKSDNHLY